MAHTFVIIHYFRFMLCITFTLSNTSWHIFIIKFTGYMPLQDMKSCPTHAVEYSKIHNGFDTASSRFQTRQPTLSQTCIIGFKSGNKLSRGRLAMCCSFLYSLMMRVQKGLAMSSLSMMFWPSSESKGDLAPDSRISSWYFLAFKFPVTTVTFNCIRWSSDKAPRPKNHSVTIPCTQEPM